MPKTDDRASDWERACGCCGKQLLPTLSVTFKEFCRLVGVGRTTAWALARDKKIELREIGRRRVVLTRSIEKLLRMRDGEDR